MEDERFVPLGIGDLEICAFGSCDQRAEFIDEESGRFYCDKHKTMIENDKEEYNADEVKGDLDFHNDREEGRI